MQFDSFCLGRIAYSQIIDIWTSTSFFVFLFSLVLSAILIYGELRCFFRIYSGFPRWNWISLWVDCIWKQILDKLTSWLLLKLMAVHVFYLAKNSCIYLTFHQMYTIFNYFVNPDTVMKCSDRILLIILPSLFSFFFEHF